MMLAEAKDGSRVLATPGELAICPLCKSDVIPKCGEIKTWHWAHKSLTECDSWGEPESEWHYSWKKLFGLENTEITVKRGEVLHRADVKIGNKIIELQHSHLPPSEVREREQFYENMVWILDGETAPRKDYTPVEKWLSKKGKWYYKFFADRMKPWTCEISKPQYIHFDKLGCWSHHWVCDSRTRSGWAVDSDGFEVLHDVVVIPNGMFCKVVSKKSAIEQLKRWAGT